VTFSPDGQCLAVVADGKIQLYDSKILSDDEKAARFYVERLFDDLLFPEPVMETNPNQYDVAGNCSVSGSRIRNPPA
jgi:hypothetical protein